MKCEEISLLSQTNTDSCNLYLLDKHFFKYPNVVDSLNCAEAEMMDANFPDVLPEPDRLHHIVEDFLTEFDAPISHILPTRR